jgi:hypothetical protein
MIHVHAAVERNIKNAVEHKNSIAILVEKTIHKDMECFLYFYIEYNNILRSDRL